MKRLPRLTVYRAKDGWRWNYRAANGRIMADSAEAYVERGKCVRAAAQVLRLTNVTSDCASFPTHTHSQYGGEVDVQVWGKP